MDTIKVPQALEIKREEYSFESEGDSSDDTFVPFHWRHDMITAQFEVQDPDAAFEAARDVMKLMSVRFSSSSLTHTKGTPGEIGAQYSIYYTKFVKPYRRKLITWTLEDLQDNGLEKKVVIHQLTQDPKTFNKLEETVVEVVIGQQQYRDWVVTIKFAEHKQDCGDAIDGDPFFLCCFCLLPLVNCDQGTAYKKIVNNIANYTRGYTKGSIGETLPTPNGIFSLPAPPRGDISQIETALVFDDNDISTVDQLGKLFELYQAGALTEKEYEIQKAKLM